MDSNGTGRKGRLDGKTITWMVVFVVGFFALVWLDASVYGCQCGEAPIW